MTLALERLEAGGAHWNYQLDDDHGPDGWTDICQEGTQQSPIDIRGAVEADLGQWRFWNYDSNINSAEIVNNGHTIKLTPVDSKVSSVSGGLV